VTGQEGIPGRPGQEESFAILGVSESSTAALQFISDGSFYLGSPRPAENGICSYGGGARLNPFAVTGSVCRLQLEWIHGLVRHQIRSWSRFSVAFRPLLLPHLVAVIVPCLVPLHTSYCFSLLSHLHPTFSEPLTRQYSRADSVRLAASPTGKHGTSKAFDRDGLQTAVTSGSIGTLS
jgi:hypothetical protein